MVRVNDEGEYVRRPAAWNDLPARAHRLLERLLQARLLVVREESGERSVEVAHEALLRKWPRLRGWLDQEREFLIGKTQLERSLRDWEQAEPGARAAALLQGLQLTRAQQWLVEHAGGLSEAERGYIQASIAHGTAVEKKAFRQRAALLASVLVLVVVGAVGGPWAYGVISEQRLIDREAARTDIRGQIMAYATAVVGGTALDQAEGAETSPYTTPLVQRLRQRNKSLIQALADVHQDVIRSTREVQRPFLSTSMNGQIYLWQQPETRAKRAVVVSVDDIGWPNIPRLLAPKFDAAAVVALLRQAGFEDSEIIPLHNVPKAKIAQALLASARSLRSREKSAAPPSQAPDRPPVIPAAVEVKPKPEPPPNTLLLFFFSGHGMSVDGHTYILPDLAGSRLRTDAELQAAAVNVQALMNYASENAAASVVILDTHFPEYRLPGGR
jgi:hypothetical protein